MLKGAQQDEIVRAIHAVATGEAIFGPGIARRVLGLISAPAAHSTPFPALTSREHEVLDLIAAGARNTEIARRMSIAPKTVANHIAAIFTKLQVADRNQAIILARERRPGQEQSNPRYRELLTTAGIKLGRPSSIRSSQQIRASTRAGSR